jgi:hypothetical protein
MVPKTIILGTHEGTVSDYWFSKGDWHSPASATIELQFVGLVDVERFAKASGTVGKITVTIELDEQTIKALGLGDSGHEPK